MHNRNVHHNLLSDFAIINIKEIGNRKTAGPQSSPPPPQQSRHRNIVYVPSILLKADAILCTVVCYDMQQKIHYDASQHCGIEI